MLQNIKAAEDEFFVPVLSVNFSVILALLNVGILIYFIHYVSTSIQAEKVIAVVYQHLEENIHRLFREETDAEQKQDLISVTTEEKKKYKFTERIFSLQTGYLQTIDYHSLLSIAEKRIN